MSEVTVTYKNTNGKELVLGRFAPFFMLSFSGFGTPENNVVSQNLFGIDGAQKIAQQLNVRDMEVIMRIMARNFDDLQHLKRTAISVLNPSLAGTIIYTTPNGKYEIDVEVIKGIDEAEDNTATTQKASLQFRALDPYWRDRSFYNNLIPLSHVRNLFKFPVNIVEKFKFAEMIPGEIITIENEGDAQVGAVFTMSFTKVVENPKIYNIRTQEYFGFNKTFNAGDKVTINTIRNQKRVLFKPNGGEEVNAMSMRMQGSTFLVLNQGNTYLQIQATSGLEGIIANLDYSPLVLGV